MEAISDFDLLLVNIHVVFVRKKLFFMKISIVFALNEVHYCDYTSQ
jgi:hypothetical protein